MDRNHADDGSTVTLLDSELAEQLGVTGIEESMTIDTITGTTSNIPVKFIDFDIRGKHGNETYRVHKARAIPNLKLRPQEVTITDTNFNHLRDLSEDLIFTMATPKVLIGTSDWPLLISRENRVGNAHEPVATRTALGWVVFGEVPRSVFFTHSFNHVSDNKLDSLIKYYYELDSLGIKHENKVNKEDARAISILETTTRRLENGRFEVGLPWREDEPNIPSSYHLALSRFEGLRRRFAKDKEYAELYRVNIEAYVEKGYAEECNDSHGNSSSSSRRWYLPHFGVTNPNKPGKLRIVHDASATSSGVSLNSLILPGPDMLQSLLGILMRFREGQIALNGDIREMFPQIKIREEDRDCQRYIWHSPDGHLTEFRMSSLIFGASASPFTAIYIKNRNAKDFQDKYPNAAESIIRDHYMDDFLGSCDDLDTAARLAADVQFVHQQCGFEMRSWVSNAPEALKFIPVELHKTNTTDVDLNLDGGAQKKADVRVLGMHWNPRDDTFGFKIDIDIPLPSKFTKRQVLRDLMRVYDPLGLLQPIVTRERFSDWRRLLRTTARVFQFTRLLRERETRAADTIGCPGLRPLLARDVKNAELYLLKQTQRDSFAEELDCLMQNKDIPKRSRLNKLAPKLCQDGLIRATGRISSAPEVAIEAKEPIILDGRHPTIRLFISRYHIWALHGNNETVVNELRQRFAILHLRPAVRSIASQCRVCRMRKATPTVPPIGDLPMERLQHHHRPFSFVGLDYFGPVDVAVRRSREKRYVALFTCLVTRAVHLEVVGSLSADSAIMALRRFIARRGCPTKILSDNGTAFVGANRLLKEAWAEIDHTYIRNFAATNNIEWEFIPPASPFMGGTWERLVRSVKRGLAVVLKERAPREEVLATLLAEVEQVVNARPLTHVPVSHDEAPALTPNHFLSGANACLPAPASTESDLISRQNWKKAVRLADQFWSRWVKEYLPDLLPRGLSSNQHRNLNIGDLVFICDGNLPRNVWPRGRVEKVFPGKDGIVRVADVRTSAGVLRRPARKIVKLDLSP
ncbi:uncharacterized protein LOC135078664 [Ostrinia nubilalis]|uniref:uncharacterized protein LOC135078664 n=1 Tax=Ostrinia nubilalis TaxID=29057 RepID=UPI0030822117